MNVDDFISSTFLLSSIFVLASLHKTLTGGSLTE